MHPSVDHAYIRLLWGIVEASGPRLHGLNDEAICSWLLKRMGETLYLSAEEIIHLRQYVADRVHLIRDIAESMFSDNS